MNDISLSELAGRIEQAIQLNFGKPVWVRAEISELRVNGGHCYMELIEKSEDSDNIMAKCRATCWSSTFRMLKPYFESSTGQALRAGLKVLVAVTVEFHKVYGMSLNVRDIDPVFTVGEMAARRLQIIRRLEEEGIADMNKLLAVPVPAQRVAIISSPTAAGYEDFCNQLAHNRFGYAFQKQLFPAIMQGEAAGASIVVALDEIYACADSFDVVVIIRGGGAATDLAVFDSYDLAVNCAQFPLPIISGIGHQRDVSILDMVAHTSVKTPTAVAEWLIDNMQRAEEQAMEIFTDIFDRFRQRLEHEHRQLERAQWRKEHALKNMTAGKHFWLANAERRLKSAVEMQLAKQDNRMEKNRNRLRSAVKLCLSAEENRLNLLDKNIRSYSPLFLLERGYTLTTLNGRRLTSASGIRPGERLRTYFPDGTVDSEVL